MPLLHPVLSRRKEITCVCIDKEQHLSADNLVAFKVLLWWLFLLVTAISHQISFSSSFSLSVTFVLSQNEFILPLGSQ